MLRIDRALQTLKGWIDQPVLSVPQIELLAGDFSTCRAARIQTDWNTVDLPWLKSTQDERYFIEFELKLPPLEENTAFFIEVSTGREGEWDAVNPQFLAYVNDQVICGLDVNHRLIHVKPDWMGKKITVNLHLYTGMAAGDLRFRVRLIKRSNEIYNAYHDLRVAFETLKIVPEMSEGAFLIKRILSDAVMNLRLNAPQCSETTLSCVNLSQFLEKELYGHTTDLSRFVVHAVGHTHIDVAWLWDLNQTKEKVARSYATALDLQSRYSDYKFMASQPILYEMLSEGQPEVFDRVLESSKNGLWESEGAMYLEADCNLISGESMIRQIEWGQRYFKSHFGKHSKTLWLPDVFGYSAALPQILSSFGIEMFVTSKISWNEHNQLPYDSFLWKGIDGTQIATQFITTTSMETLKKGEFKTIYEGNFTPTEVLGTIMRHQQKEIQPHTIMPYGYGDGGGGATEEMLETAKRLSKGLPGMPSVRMSHVSDFIEGYNLTSKDKLPVWVGELYLEYHRGTYTTNGAIKKKHRTLEDVLLMAERLHTIMAPFESDIWPDLDAPWQKLLLNQFHDILPGTSIKRVYDEAYVQLDNSLEQVETQISSWMQRMVIPSEDSLLLYNPHGQTFSGIVEIQASLLAETDLSKDMHQMLHIEMKGEHSPVQFLDDGRAIAYIKNLSPMSVGIAKLMKMGVDEANKNESPFDFETPFYRVAIDPEGAITSLFDLAQKRELIAESGYANHLVCFEDRPLRWDAWDINEDYKQFPLSYSMPAKIKLIEDGCVALIIEVVKELGNSKIIQRIYFYKDSKRIDFKTTVDWHEKQVLLRVEFDLDVNATEAKFDIQYGHVKRPVDQNHSYHSSMFEVCGAHWGDLSEDDFGVTLMSNDKFGYSALGATLGMSLIKSPTWPNESSDQGLHEFEYALYPHEGNVIYGNVHNAAMNYSQKPRLIKGDLKQPQLFKPWLKNLPENLRVESLRHLDENLIELRLVEHFNRRGTADIIFRESFSEVSQVTLNGKVIRQIPCEQGKLTLSYKPFEIITLMLRV